MFEACFLEKMSQSEIETRCLLTYTAAIIGKLRDKLSEHEKDFCRVVIATDTYERPSILDETLREGKISSCRELIGIVEKNQDEFAKYLQETLDYRKEFLNKFWNRNKLK